MKEFLNLRRTFVIALFIGFFAMAARNVLDPDVWWHLKTGEWMVQHGAIPHADPFSFTRAGQPWIAHEWLSELAIYGIFRLTGYAGLIVAFAAIISAAFIPLYLRCRANPVASAAVTLWGALATAVVWGVRPQMLSLLLLSVWLLILERSEQNPKLLWWTLPLTLLWVNLHAAFILGPVFIGLFIAGELIETIVSSRHWFQSVRLRWLTFALIADLCLVPFNPNGASIFWYPVETLRSGPMQKHISEWASPDFHGIYYRAFFFLLLTVFASFAFSQRRVRGRDLLLLGVSTVAALSSVRMIPLFVLMAVPPVARAVADWLATGEASASPSFSQSAVVNAGLLLALLAFATAHTVQVIHRQAQAEAAIFPTGAAEYLDQHPPAGPLFNHVDWGGYLIFKLYPTTRVFIDGRADVYGEGLTQFVDSYYLQNCWLEPLSRWKVTTVIVPPHSPLASALREQPDWSRSYRDSVAEIFTKSLSGSVLPGNPCSSNTTQPSNITGAHAVHIPLPECKNLHLSLQFARYDVSYQVSLPPLAVHGRTFKTGEQKSGTFFSFLGG
jgi:hypothetical protein